MRISRNRCQYCRMQRCIMAGMSHEGKYAYSRPVGLDFNVNRFSYIPRVSVTRKEELRSRYTYCVLRTETSSLYNTCTCKCR